MALTPAVSTDDSAGTCATTGTLAGTSNSVSPTHPVPGPPGASAARPVQFGDPGGPEPRNVSLITVVLPPLTSLTVAPVMTCLTVALVIV